MKHNSFFVKLFVGNLLLVGTIVAVGAALSYRSLDAHFVEENETHQAHVLSMAQRFFETVWPVQSEQIDRQCKEMGSAQGMRFTVVADDGSVLGDSEGDIRRMENHRQGRPEIAAALDGKAGRDVRRSETLNIEFRYMALPLRHDGKVVATVRTAMPIHTIVEGGSFISTVLIWSALGVAVVASVLGMLINFLWYSPLRQVTRTARRIASGNLMARVPGFSTAELSQLSSAINDMRENLSRQIEMIQAQREDLQAVVSSLQEGVLATDAQGLVILANKAMVDLLCGGDDKPDGKNVQTVVRSLSVVDVFNQALSTGQTVSRQIETELSGQRRYLEVRASPLRGTREQSLGGLLVVHDVTDITRTAAVKAEFVANASHELRTPLATLRAAVDSLGAIEPDDREALSKFINILDRHVGRLENMTRDLLDLHLIESGRTRLRADRISLKSLADWARANFADRVAGKGLAFDVRAQDEEDVLIADRVLVELILQNLIENAIKFTSAGRVECLFAKQGEAFLLQVSDTGMGIATEARGRVFERFFQVDSSRSGEPKIRGTGLGLAIVKHAADRLGARVELQSQTGEGTVVSVLMPASPPQ